MSQPLDNNLDRLAERFAKMECERQTSTGVGVPWNHLSPNQQANVILRIKTRGPSLYDVSIELAKVEEKVEEHYEKTVLPECAEHYEKQICELSSPGHCGKHPKACQETIYDRPERYSPEDVGQFCGRETVCTACEREEARMKPLVDFIQEYAGQDCHRTTKHFSQPPCGECESCSARAALKAWEGK